jgi:hypothetical protein
MKSLIRLLATGILVVVAVRVLDAILAPALPLVITLLTLVVIAYLILRLVR